MAKYFPAGNSGDAGPHPLGTHSTNKTIIDGKSFFMT
jgi:hypothetical protein